MVELRALGTLSIRGPDGSELHSLIAQPKRAALLAYLCVAARHGFRRRDTLLGLFWPESDEAHARAALRKALHGLRRAVGEATIVSRGEYEVGVDSASIWCDAVAFQDFVDANRLGEAIAVYQGELLPGFFLSGAPEFERWLERERSRLRHLAARAAERLADHLESEGKVAEAVTAARVAVSLAETDEQALRRLLNLLNKSGDRTGAIATYDAFVREVAANAGVEPSAETRSLVGRIRARNAEPILVDSREAQSLGVESTAAMGLPAAVPALPDAPSVPLPSRASRTRHRRLISVAAMVGVVGAVAGTATLMRPRLAPLPRIAVLPLRNMSADSADQYFAEIMHGELMSRLGMIPSIRVTSRNSVMRYRADSSIHRIAEALNVDFVLVGSAARDSSRIFVSMSLIDARTEAELWKHSYTEDRTVARQFDVQTNIARRVADALEVKIGATVRGRIANRPTTSTAAYELYARASQLDWERASNRTRRPKNSSSRRSLSIHASRRHWRISGWFIRSGHMFLAHRGTGRTPHSSSRVWR